MIANLCDIWRQNIGDLLESPASRVLALHKEMIKRLEKQKQEANRQRARR